MVNQRIGAARLIGVASEYQWVPGRRRTSRGFYAAALLGIIAVTMVVALVLSEASFVLRTWITSVAGLVGLWGLLLHHHDGHLPLSMDVMATIGFSMSVLVPPLYLCFRLTTGYRVDEYHVLDMSPLVSIWTTVGATALLLGYDCIDRRISTAIRSHQESTVSIVLVVIATLAVAWTARLILVAVGAYYYAFANADFVFGRWYSVTGGLAKYGLVAPLMLWLLAARDSRLRVWAAAASIGEIAYIVPTGARKETIQLLFGLMLVGWSSRQKPPTLRLAALCLSGAIAVPIVGQYRNTIREYSDVDHVTSGATVAALGSAKSRFEKESEQGGSPLDYGDVFFNRLYDGQMFGYLLKHYTESYPLEDGRTYYTRIPWLAVPYFVYADRPIMQVPLDTWFPLTPYGSNPSTFIGEAYINFGYAGIPFIAFAMGLVLGLFDRAFSVRRDSVVAAAIYILTCAFTPFLVSASLASWLGILRNSVIMLALFGLLQHLAQPLAFGDRPMSARSRTQ